MSAFDKPDSPKTESKPAHMDNPLDIHVQNCYIALFTCNTSPQLRCHFRNCYIVRYICSCVVTFAITLSSKLEFGNSSLK